MSYSAGLLAGFGYIVAIMASVVDRSREENRTFALSMMQNSIDLGIAGGCAFFGLIFTSVSFTNTVYLYTAIALCVYSLVLSRCSAARS